MLYIYIWHIGNIYEKKTIGKNIYFLEKIELP